MRRKNHQKRCQASGKKMEAVTLYNTCEISNIFYFILLLKHNSLVRTRRTIFIPVGCYQCFIRKMRASHLLYTTVRSVTLCYLLFGMSGIHLKCNIRENNEPRVIRIPFLNLSSFNWGELNTQNTKLC